MHRGLLLYCSMLALTSASSQGTKIDSLHQVLQRRAPDTATLMTLVNIADHYKFTKYDSALFFARKVVAYPNSTPFDRYKMYAHNIIGYASYFKGAYTESIEGFQQYHAYAQKLNDKANSATALTNIGNVHIELGEYGKALQLYQEGLQLRQQIGNPLEIARSYNNIGFVYKDLGDYEKAVHHFLIALKTYEQRNSLADMTYSYNYLGSVFYQKKDYPSAISYQQKALAIQQRLHDQRGAAISLQSLANIYGAQRKYTEALEYFRKAQNLYVEQNDLRQLALVNSSIGAIFSRQKKPAEAIPYYLQAIALNQQIFNRRSLAEIWLQAAEAYIDLKDLGAARSLIDSAAAVTKMTGNKEHLRSLYEVETQWHRAGGKYQEALQYASLFAAQKDTLLNEASIKSLADMQVKYETEKKVQQIALLSKDNAIKELEIQNQQLVIGRNLFVLTQNKLALSQADLQLAQNQIRMNSQNSLILHQQLDSTNRAKDIQGLRERGRIQQLEIANRQLQVTRRNTIIGILIVSFLFATLLLLSYYRRYRMKQQVLLQAAILKQQEEATKAVLEAEEAERQRIAKDLHDGVGQMMSAAKMNLSAFEHSTLFGSAAELRSFQNIISLVDDSCREVRLVSHNMMPNALLKNSLAAAVRSFVDKLDHKVLAVQLYTEGLDERLDANMEAVLYRVVQECVNNVIKHSGAQMLDLSLVKEEGAISVTVEDNGVGFNPGDVSFSEGMGLKNIRTRVAYLKGTVEINAAPGRGTLVAVHIPL